MAGERTASGQQEEQDGGEEEDDEKEEERYEECRSQEPRDEGATRAYISKEKETRPIVIAIPKGRMFLRRCVPSHADPQANPNHSHPTVPFLSSQQRSNRLHNLPPAPLVCRGHHTYTTPPPWLPFCRAAPNPGPLAVTTRETATVRVRYLGSTVYEKCSTCLSKRSRTTVREP